MTQQFTSGLVRDHSGSVGAWIAGLAGPCFSGTSQEAPRTCVGLQILFGDVHVSGGIPESCACAGLYSPKGVETLCKLNFCKGKEGPCSSRKCSPPSGSQAPLPACADSSYVWYHIRPAELWVSVARMVKEGQEGARSLAQDPWSVASPRQ